MMMAIACGRTDFVFLFVLIRPDYEVAKHGAKHYLRTGRHITLPPRHIKATMRTGKTGKAPAFSHKKTCEIFWQAVSDNPHLRPLFVAKSQTKIISPIRKFARIPLVGGQGITAKPANNYDKAHDALVSLHFTYYWLWDYWSCCGSCRPRMRIITISSGSIR
jgi:hypothetical protein